MLQEAVSNGYLERYRPELEYTFTMLFYINTLFTYMQGVRPVRADFVEKLGREMRETFPEFQKNRYYLERTGAEEKKLAAMHMRSTLQFILYYKLLWGYRNCRKKLKETFAKK